MSSTPVLFENEAIATFAEARGRGVKAGFWPDTTPSTFMRGLQNREAGTGQGCPPY